MEIPEFMIRGINCAILLFHPLKWKSPKNTKETMNEPGKTRDEAWLAILHFQKDTWILVRKQKEEILANYTPNATSATTEEEL